MQPEIQIGIAIVRVTRPSCQSRFTKRRSPAGAASGIIESQDRKRMEQVTHSTIVNFIWGIADDVLRDVYVRGKYRDVILPMTVIRRLDCLLEPTHDAVLKQKEFLDSKGIL